MMQTNRYATVPEFTVMNGNVNVSPAISSTSTKQAYIFRAPATGSIRKVHAQWGNVTGTNTATLSLQNVDSSGNPDGIDDQTATSATPVSQTRFSVAFSSDRSVVIGELVAFVVGCSAIGTNFQLRGNTPWTQDDNGWIATYNGSAWALSGNISAMVVEYSDGSIYPMIGILPNIFANVNLNTGSSPSEAGTRFRLPYPVRAAGLELAIQPSPTATYDGVLYDDSMNVLASASRTTVRAALGNAVRSCIFFSSSVSLNANTWYRIGVKPTSVNNVGCGYFDVTLNSHLAGCPGGADWYYWSRTGAGSVTDNTTRRMMTSLIVDQLEAGGGGTPRRSR